MFPEAQKCGSAAARPLAAETGRGAEQVAAYRSGGDIAGWHITPDEDDAPNMNAASQQPGVTTKHASGFVPWVRDGSGETSVNGRDANALDAPHAGRRRILSYGSDDHPMLGWRRRPPRIDGSRKKQCSKNDKRGATGHPMRLCRHLRLDAETATAPKGGLPNGLRAHGARLRTHLTT